MGACAIDVGDPFGLTKKIRSAGQEEPPWLEQGTGA